MEIVGGAVGAVQDSAQSKATDQLVDSIWRQFGYVWNYRSNIEDLKDQVKKLKAERDSVQHRVDEARRNGEEIESTVRTWLTTADDTTEAAGVILDDIDRAKKINCCIGIVSSNFKTRYLLSRRASKETPGIVEVRKEGSQLDNISYHIPTAMLRMKTFRDYEDFESRTFIFDQIAKELKDGGKSLIGVYGIGGVGKTTLVKKIADKVRKDGIFKVVIRVSLTQNHTVRMIQQEIADWLDLKFDTESTHIRSVRLWPRLKQEQNVLIILDDVCERIQLEEIGIPRGNDHKTCKILVTSKNKRVLSQMGVEKEFQLEVLQEEEAWQLFENRLLENDILKDPDLQTMAMEVVKRCGGLPVLIAAVGNALTNKEDYEWKDLLNQLKQIEKLQLDDQFKLVL